MIGLLAFDIGLCLLLLAHGDFAWSGAIAVVIVDALRRYRRDLLLSEGFRA